MSPVSAAAEPLSPELVLVCPELRDRAFQLAEPAWETAAREARARASVSVPPPRRTPLLPRAATAGLLRFALWAIAAVLVVGGATLLLTFVADALRQGPF
jgi:hypothetical protein